MTPEQCIAARRLLGWSQLQLAIAAYCSSSTVKSFEGGAPKTHRSTRSAIASAFEAAGVMFTNGVPSLGKLPSLGDHVGTLPVTRDRGLSPSGLVTALRDLADVADAQGISDTAKLLRDTLEEIGRGDRLASSERLLGTQPPK